MTLRRAERKQLKARIAIMGPAKAGKSLSALRLGTMLAQAAALVRGDPSNLRIAAIDTERGSLEKYQGMDYDGVPIDFMVEDQMKDFGPTTFEVTIAKIVRDAKPDVLIVDSLSHEWMGPGGALELHDAA